MRSTWTIFATLAVLAGPALGQSNTTTPRPQPTPAPSSSDRSSPSPRTTPEPNRSAPAKPSGAIEDEETIKQRDRARTQNTR